jgi:transketolase
MVVASISPPPLEDITAALVRVGTALTVEAHYTSGGLGSLACEIVAERGIACRVVRCGVKTGARGVSGSQAYLHGIHGLTPDSLADTAQAALRER